MNRIYVHSWSKQMCDWPNSYLRAMSKLGKFLRNESVKHDEYESMSEALKAHTAAVKSGYYFSNVWGK